LGINPVLVGVVAVVIIALFIILIAKVHFDVSPKTTLGKWSIGLAIAFILSFLLAEMLYGDNHFSGVVLAIILVGIGGASFITGLISVIKHKERSILTLVGMAITFWWGLIGAVGVWII
jgi:hypothetical protein